mgnify:CR=1 FL=1
MTTSTPYRGFFVEKTRGSVRVYGEHGIQVGSYLVLNSDLRWTSVDTLLHDAGHKERIDRMISGSTVRPMRR